MMSETKYYTIREVAKLLRVNPRTVENLILTGQLSATKVGRQWRISQSQLDQYLARHT